MGIENNDEWNLRDLRGMRRNIKALKRNDGERKGILIAPSKLPRFSLGVRFHSDLLHPQLAANVSFGAKIRGTDGKPAIHSRQSYGPRLSLLALMAVCFGTRRSRTPD